MPLEPGDPAPPVTAATQTGERITVDFEAPAVLFFYPADATPGCTTEANQFDRELETYRDAGVDVSLAERPVDWTSDERAPQSRHGPRRQTGRDSLAEVFLLAASSQALRLHRSSYTK